MSSHTSSSSGSRRSSFREQLDLGQQRGRRPPLLMPNTEQEKEDFSTEIGGIADDVTAPFESKFEPSDMRQLALVAHNHMKPAMKEFIQTFSEILKKFRITGTQTTMRMCKTLWGEDDPEIEYGLTCTSGPLGGDAQIAALMCMEDLGALIFFIDPLSAHPHQADIDSLLRLTNCGNVIVCPNPTSAISMMHTLKYALEKGSRGMIPSFFQTLESPAVAEYKRQQNIALVAAVAGGTTPAKAELLPGISFRAPSAAPPKITFDPDSALFAKACKLREIASLGEEEDEDEEDDFFGEEREEDSLDKVEEKLSQVRRVSMLYGIPQPKKRSGKRQTMKKVRESIRKLTSL